jgi:glycosyltransferase
MKITVITVAYNSAKTIKDTLNAVAMQTYTDVEHLVIDGASKDG